MSRRLDHVRTGALALSIALTLVHCGGEDGAGGGNTALRLFFGMNGDGSCNSVIVSVDLADSDAVLARGSGGAPDCSLDVSLSNAGCTATFSELDGGDRLRVAIAGCAIPAVTNLFSCSFENVDLSDLRTETSAVCACQTAGCDGGPPLCIDDDPDPRSCEDCDNGRDDDGNGLSDCDDPNCEHAPECAPAVTTTSVTTTSEASSTTVTTTLPPAEPIFIRFRLSSSPAPLGALQFTANYTSAPGRFEGKGEDVLCSNQLDDSIFAAFDDDQRKKLTLGWAATGGFSAPVDLATCQFQPDTPVPVPANFTIVIDEAIDPDGKPVKARIDVTVVDERQSP